MVALVSASPGSVGGSLGSQRGSPLLRGPLGDPFAFRMPSEPSIAFRRRNKREVAEAFLAQLRTRDGFDLDAPGLVDGVYRHFEGLPPRYAHDVNITSLDVLNHKRLLDSVRADMSSVSFQVRPVEVRLDDLPGYMELPFSRERSEVLPPRSNAHAMTHSRSFPRPAFGSSPNLHALALEVEGRSVGGREGGALASGGLGALSRVGTPPGQLMTLGAGAATSPISLAGTPSRPAAAAAFHEITIASVDQPKLLARLSECLSDLGLDIAEAHVFGSSDGLTLDVFVVSGWPGDPAALEDALSDRLQELPPPAGPHSGAGPSPASSRAGDGPAARGGAGDGPAARHEGASPADHELGSPRSLPVGSIADPAGAGAAQQQAQQQVSTSDWELDPRDVTFVEKIASGAFGDLYRGAHCGQDVAIKILRGVLDGTSAYAEFLSEVSILRRVRHRNVVQFIGACTVRPNLCIVFEYMSRGSAFEYVRAHGPLRPAPLLKMAVEAARGMDYLHRRRIVHRDLKAANLLLDEAGTLKIGDFGVARVLDPEGVMTAETGTYRWMAPEVVEHAPYGPPADVYSFGIVLWELLTARVPYAELSPLQAAVGVVQSNLRPHIPRTCPQDLADVMHACWQRDPALRPTFAELVPRLEAALRAARQQQAALAHAAHRAPAHAVQHGYSDPDPDGAPAGAAATPTPHGHGHPIRAPTPHSGPGHTPGAASPSARVSPSPAPGRHAGSPAHPPGHFPAHVRPGSTRPPSDEGRPQAAATPHPPHHSPTPARPPSQPRPPAAPPQPTPQPSRGLLARLREQLREDR